MEDGFLLEVKAMLVKVFWINFHEQEKLILESSIRSKAFIIHITESGATLAPFSASD